MLSVTQFAWCSDRREALPDCARLSFAAAWLCLLAHIVVPKVLHAGTQCANFCEVSAEQRSALTVDQPFLGRA